mgnify:CR=1 FL=1
MPYMSRPSRARGLKSAGTDIQLLESRVAPLAGAWIEIARQTARLPVPLVAPLAGAWIEMERRHRRCAVRPRRAPRGRVD